jgi:hypothetical protein
MPSCLPKKKHPPIQWVKGVVSPGVKRTEKEGEYYGTIRQYIGKAGPYLLWHRWSYNRVTWRKSSVLEEPNASILGFKKRWAETVVSFTDRPASLPKHINLQYTDDRKLQRIVWPSCPLSSQNFKKQQINMNCMYRYSSYRTVNTISLRYKRQFSYCGIGK